MFVFVTIPRGFIFALLDSLNFGSRLLSNNFAKKGVYGLKSLTSVKKEAPFPFLQTNPHKLSDVSNRTLFMADNN
jgi:hypothetical protein